MWSLLNNNNTSIASATPSLYEDEPPQSKPFGPRSLSPERRRATVVSKCGREFPSESHTSRMRHEGPSQNSRMRSLSPRGRIGKLSRSTTNIDSFARRSDGKRRETTMRSSINPKKNKNNNDATVQQQHNLRVSNRHAAAPTTAIPNSLPGQEKHQRRRLRSLSPDSVRSSIMGKFSKSSASQRSVLSNSRGSHSYKYRDRSKSMTKLNMETSTTTPGGIVIYEPTTTVPSKALAEEPEPETYFTKLVSFYEYITGTATARNSDAPSPPQSKRILVYPPTNKSESARKTTPPNLARKGPTQTTRTKGSTTTTTAKDEAAVNETPKSVSEDGMSSFLQQMLQSVTTSWGSKKEVTFADKTSS
ncbi:hypothetical protein ACA910_008780 [Epithemia clementina (nom. ined.)]